MMRNALPLYGFIPALRCSMVRAPSLTCRPSLLSSKINPVARYATYRDTALASNARASIARQGLNSWSNQQRPRPSLLRPALFTTLFTGSAFSLAYYADQKGFSNRDKVTKTRILTGIIAVNCLVFALFHIPPYWAIARPISRFLGTYGQATLQNATRNPLALLTSGFSHAQVWHLGFNMLGFWNIASALYDAMGPNQFLAIYTSTIVFSSFAQLAFTAWRARRGFAPIGAMGASGGIYGLLGLLAWYMPDARLSFIILPFLQVSLGYAFAGMMCVDAAGMALGWSRLGHAAHFSGGAAGFATAASGLPQWWEQQRRRAVANRMARWGW